MANSALVTALGVLTTISQVALTLIPAPELYGVHKTKNIGDMIISPLVAMWINNHLWVVYAYPTGNIFPLFSVCVFAEFMSILYIIFYAYHCDNRVYVAKAVGLGLVVFVPVTVYLILAEVDVIHQTDSQVGDILGYLAVAMNFVLYLSPLEKVKQVLVTKSAASIPVLMSSAIGFNSLLWFVTGVVDHDIYLLASNAVGTVLSATQVVLYFIYRPGRHSSAPATGDPSKEALQVDLEMQELATRGSPRSPAFQPLASPLAPIRP